MASRCLVLAGESRLPALVTSGPASSMSPLVVLIKSGVKRPLALSTRPSTLLRNFEVNKPLALSMRVSTFLVKDLVNNPLALSTRLSTLSRNFEFKSLLPVSTSSISFFLFSAFSKSFAFWINGRMSVSTGGASDVDKYSKVSVIWLSRLGSNKLPTPSKKSLMSSPRDRVLELELSTEESSLSTEAFTLSADSEFTPELEEGVSLSEEPDAVTVFGAPDSWTVWVSFGDWEGVVTDPTGESVSG